MRISLLLQREPFGKILTETLERFWQQQYDKPFNVNWIWKPRANSTPGESFDLFCNIYLNAIFPATTRNGALDPIRREFSRSVVAWRTPLQQAYCRLALSPKWARWFKQAVVRVSPPHDGLPHQIVVPGNNKIRILDRQHDCAYGVLKHNFSTDRFENEINARQRAETLGIPVPKLLENDAKAGWFKEAYVSGTPLNRVADRMTVATTARRAGSQLKKLTESTTEETTVGQYTDQLMLQIERYRDSSGLLGDERRQTLNAVLQTLLTALKPTRRQQLLTAETHGDFQPANILVDNDAFWIIDWEYAKRRQLAYDLLVFHCESRRGKGLASRLLRFVDSPPSDSSLPFNSELSSRANRHRAAMILLLEEFALRLAENANPQFTNIDVGLTRLIGEVELWNRAQ